MSLDNIQLPPFVLQDLFRDSLIDLNSGKAISAAAPAAGPAFLGNNKKRISIVVNAPDALYLSDEELNFLLGILTACKLTMEDVALINFATQQPLDYRQLDQELKAQTIILFGITPADLQLPLAFPHYQVQQYNNQVYLSSPALKTLQGDKAEKTKLWTCLKNIFQLG